MSLRGVGEGKAVLKVNFAMSRTQLMSALVRMQYFFIFFKHMLLFALFFVICSLVVIFCQEGKR